MLIHISKATAQLQIMGRVVFGFAIISLYDIPIFCEDETILNGNYVERHLMRIIVKFCATYCKQSLFKLLE